MPVVNLPLLNGNVVQTTRSEDLCFCCRVPKKKPRENNEQSFPAVCGTACQQLTASVLNVSIPICNYFMHLRFAEWTHKDWPRLCYRCAYANRP